MKKNSRFAGFYMGLIFFLMYLPIAVVIVFSFNESKLPVKFTGFSLKWYQELIHDRAMLEALVNSLILGVLSCLVSAVIGTLGAVGLSRIHWKSKGALEYISILPLMIPEIILGMVLMAFFYMLNLPFGITLGIGAFISAIINFIILAFVLFCLIKGMNALMNMGHHKEEEKPAEPAAPAAPTQEELLAQILAELKAQNTAKAE